MLNIDTFFTEKKEKKFIQWHMNRYVYECKMQTVIHILIFSPYTQILISMQ